jgi:hypothetical protein
MKYRRLAVVAAFVLPSAGFCFDSTLQLRDGGDRFTTERRPAGFARAFWAADGSTWRVGSSDVSLRLAAGPSPALRAMTAGEMQPVFPKLAMPLAGRAQLAQFPRAGRSGPMLAVQIPIF